MTNEKMAQLAQGILGNTKPKSQAKKHRRWCFTLNNYKIKEADILAHYFIENSKYYIIGKEIGEKGTPHLQGYIEFDNARHLTALKKIHNKIHWEVAKGTREENFKYCSKENKFITNDPIHSQLLEYKNITWKNWQKDILDKLNGPINNREITWIIDEKGNSGKSFLAKYIYLKNRNECIITNGKATDTFNQILGHIQANKEIKTCIIDIPRCMNSYVSYQSIEKIKDGLFYSGKYEGGICCFKPPHIIIFSNEEPDYDQMSQDRWNIIRIAVQDTQTS